METETIVFPDVELWACDYLRHKLAAHGWDGVLVDRKVPAQRPSTFVVVRWEGGSHASVVTETGTLTIRVWAPTDQQADVMARWVKAFMASSPDGTNIVYARAMGGPYAVDDASKQPQRFLTVELRPRGQAQ